MEKVGPVSLVSEVESLSPANCLMVHIIISDHRSKLAKATDTYLMRVCADTTRVHEFKSLLESRLSKKIIG